MSRRRGLFITLEGPEGAGKSTQARRLAGWLRRRGRKVLLTREPGGTPIGMKLRRILLDKRSGNLDPLVELCLYEAARGELLRRVIRPALAAGKVVVLDRFQDSTWVYQGYAGAVDRKLVERLGTVVLAGCEPDLTLLLDLPVRRGLARVRRPNRFEAKPLRFHETVRRGYLFLSRRFPRRIRRIAADRSLQEVQDAIQREVERFLR
ncbi:MAG: dTMP kinase [Candidatus Omnitrophica bacterium CG11_big_fil_rev_8_21_14_0_20_64_10]|nr:MAG: dTMP kinase [Candidatus Omnitrophica bacterium CG11_big_fil_rev_8_21_14_0_20_64_10]